MNFSLLIVLAVLANGAWAQAPVAAPAALPLVAENDDLQTAIVNRDLPRIAAFVRARRPLDFNFDDTHRGRTHESPLTMSANRNFPDVMRLLLEGGADPKRRDGSGRAAIHQARSAETARLLVQAGADPNALDASGRTPIALAVERGDLQAIDAFLAVGARLDAPLKGSDLLARAIESRQPQLVRPLLDRGFDLRATPSQAIWLLIENGDEETASLLVQRGSDPNARGRYGEPVLLRALFRQRYALASALVDAGADLKPADAPDCAKGAAFGCLSIQLARSGSLNRPLLARMVAKGVDLNAVDAGGHTALSSLVAEQTFAVRAANGPAQIPAPDNVARVKTLLELGANPNTKYRGSTPLMLAISDPGKAAFVDVLVERGGRVEFEREIPRSGAQFEATLPGNPAIAMRIPIANDQGVHTGMSVGPLTWLLIHRRADIAVRLLERGDKVGPADRHVLYFATALDQSDAVPALLKSTREVNVPDRADVTPLMFAARAGNATAVRALLAAGARVNTRSARDWPPLLEAGLQQFIGGHGPSRPPLVGGYTALRVAKEGGHAEVARILVEAGGRD